MVGALIRRPLTISTFLLAFAVLALPAYGQTGGIRGKVVDAKKQPVQGASVLIESMDGGNRKFQAKTDRRGEFVQIGIQPGPYRISVEKDGLADIREQRISLDVLEITFTLAPGAGTGVSDEERKKAEARIAAVKADFAAGVALSKEGKHDEAIARFNQVLGQAAKCTECYLNIAAIHAERKEFDQAEATYKKALEIEPNSPEAYNGLASVYNAQKKFDQAAEMSALAQKHAGTGGAGGGGSASAVFNQGVIAWNASRIADAKKFFQEAVNLDPNLADAHYWLGMASLNEGNMDEAAKAFDSYLKIAPTGQYAEQAKGILGQIKK